MEPQNKKVSEGVTIRGLGLYFERSHTLAVSDIHLGYESGKQREGILLPHFNYTDAVTQLTRALEEAEGVKKVIINGDLKHHFGRANEQEWEEIVKLVDWLHQGGRELVVVKGNHDLQLGPVMRWKGLGIQDHYLLEAEATAFTHGNKPLPETIWESTNRIVIGNEHPAISVREGVKKETYKCFLKGHYQGKELLVLPSLLQATIGSDVLREGRLSPYLQQDLSNFEVWVVEDQPYYFGKVSNLE